MKDYNKNTNRVVAFFLAVILGIITLPIMFLMTWSIYPPHD
ncbi:MAG: hypothetical protein V1698_02430 [bacterium]